MQQDANECWTELIRCLQQQKLEIPLGDGDLNVENAEDEAKAIAMSKGLIDRYQKRRLIADRKKVVNGCFFYSVHVPQIVHLMRPG